MVCICSQDTLARQSLDMSALSESASRPAAVGGTRSESSQRPAERLRDSPSVEPAAMRSSFAVGVSHKTHEKRRENLGAPTCLHSGSFCAISYVFLQAIAPDCEKFNDVKEQQKKQWLAELGTLCVFVVL